MNSKNTPSFSVSFREKMIITFSLIAVIFSFAGGFLVSHTKILGYFDSSFTVYSPSLKETSNMIVDVSLGQKSVDSEIVENLGKPVEITPVEEIELSEVFNILKKYSEINSFKDWTMEEEGENTAILRIDYQNSGFSKFYLSKKSDSCDLEMDWLVYKVELPGDIGNCSEVVSTGIYNDDECASLNQAFLNLSKVTEERNFEEFNRYVDLDAVAVNIFNDSIASTRRVFGADSPQVQQINDLTEDQKKGEINSIKSSFEQGIKNGDFLFNEYEVNNIYDVYMNIKPEVDSEGVVFPSKIKNNTDSGEDQELGLVFSLVDGKWKVTRFKIDFDEINRKSKQQQKEFLENSES